MTGKQGRRLTAGPFLLELSAAILVFALAAAAMLSVSAGARGKSHQAAVLSAAALAATNAADYLRAGDEQGFCQAFSAAPTAGGFAAAGLLCPGEKAEAPYLLTVQKEERGALVCYSLTLTDEAGNELIALPAAWVKGGASG